MIYRLLITFLLIISYITPLQAQSGKAMIYGVVSDTTGKAIEGVNVSVPSMNQGTYTNDEGYYQLKLPANRPYVLLFTYLQVVTRQIKVGAMEPFTDHRLDITLNTDLRLSPVEIREKQINNKTNLQKLETRDIQLNPAPGGGVEGVLKTLPGVSSSSELSSSYSVRGGNYDENLVYINGVEVYRPFLVRAGQQEGLSIINPDLISSVSFSAGGFEARYGDKMSSVLDIEYKEPSGFSGSVMASLLGASAHVGGASGNHRFTYLIGARYQSNSYLLNSLDVEGDYNPAYADVQSYFTYDLSSEVEIGLLTHYGRNDYELIPEDRETSFGTPDQVVRLRVFFEGKEEMKYQTFFNALNLNYKPSAETMLRFIASSFNTREEEEFDILGQYWLDEIDTDPESENFQEAKLNLGIGTFLNHARNELFAMIYNFQHHGETILGNSSEFKWGAKIQHESIDDELHEWRMIDSAGFSLPHNNDHILELNRFESTEANLESNRFSGYVQNTFTVSEQNNGFLTIGVRGNYWDYNNEFIFSPRAQFTIQPNRGYNRRQLVEYGKEAELKNNFTIKASAGMYFQPPFYREFRDREGNLNPEIRSQKSYHATLGSEVVIRMMGRPFKWSTEVYFKYMEDLIPYDIEDVRIRYFASNNAIGYATGIDMQIYGEFIKDLPSWASLSVMRTREDIEDDQFIRVNRRTGDSVLVDTGFIRRPTDQLVNFSIYFQDFLPRFPSYKVFLNYQFGSNLPFGPPRSKQFRNALKMDPYQRVDIGFSRLIDKSILKKRKLTNNLDRIWISLEVFNLFNVQNTISHFWVRDIRNNNWPVPNYLTGRRFSLKLRAEF